MDSQKSLMESTAKATAEAIKLQLSVITGSLYTMATFVRVNPDWNQLAQDLPIAGAAVTKEIERGSNQGVSGIMYLPFGLFAAVHPKDSPLAQVLGGDVFAEENLDSLQVIETARARRPTFAGPSVVVPDAPAFLIASVPVFLSDVEEDEAWNHPFNVTSPSYCPPGLCYNSTTGEKFWGFVSTYVVSDSFFAGQASRFDVLRTSIYYYKLVRRGASFRGADEEILAVSESFPDKDFANVTVGIPGADWQLFVYNPLKKQTQNTRDGLIALIVVAAFIVSGLLLLLLTSNKEALLLLQEQVVINEKLGIANDDLLEAKCELEAEKKQNEALLERQLKLISCFEQASFKRNSRQKTLDRIAEARGCMSEASTKASEDDDVQTLELLGEGTFGKVYKGLWRSTLVAMKVIMLPANMSTSENREKMVVWEAAISSSLTHPNIVQTYTYSINTVKESDRNKHEEHDVTALGSAVQICSSACTDMDKQNLPEPQGCKSPSAGGSGTLEHSLVHNFEVRLVLEYCDKGNLQEALDQGVFMGPNGLNYPAILDSAIDIARAMLHLHSNNVLHMDLKACNVMLASSGTEGRGVSCKVSDFGLAVRMEQLETHLSEMSQGTISHMALEVLLEGRVSKAADMYAFGITLWELFTAGRPYQGIPMALLGHRVAKEGHRPSLPLVMPEGYRVLLKKCWDQKPEHRPSSFAEALEDLQRLRQEHPHPTPLLERIVSQRSSQSSQCNVPLLAFMYSPRDKKVKRHNSLSRLSNTSYSGARQKLHKGAHACCIVLYYCSQH